ncbi:UV excision repair protein RAD23 B [Phytophthora boehmeriae]|uniref:UV excision repair protein RAD23 B n=1 Tax=Phytophthora boehmeriae TaxID=109152 RepID=A0A8T1WK57_9STRA|nr:UV excision repair protein RAD23 B [Phytophthora boehmeriae]
MKLTVKTLQGVAFPLEAELTDTVVEVKQKIEGLQTFPVAQQKLIHAGKVLKDDSTLAEYNVKENDFLVVMVTKPKAPKPAAAAPAPASTPASTSTTAAAATPAAAAASTPAPAAPNTSSASSSSSATAAAVSTPSAAPATTAASSSSEASGAAASEQMNATVQQLCDMGFPEDQVRSALRAAFNNPERAVEYLMTGIPEQAAASTAAPTAAGAGGAAGGEETANTLEALRNHPQFDALRQLVQSNPAALPAVLQQIGAQSPELLRLIHQNQDRFVQMLNEPIGTREAGAAAPSSGGSGGAAPFDLGMGGGAMPTPQQIQELVDSLSPEQQAQMAAQMGMSPEQLRGLSQMLSNLPPGAMEQMMASMGGQGGMEGGAGAGAGGHRIMLSEEEAAAVDRLCEMGFERTDVIQAYLACDKNEALAANFLMDSGDFGGGGAAGGAGGQGDDNDDIYG